MKNYSPYRDIRREALIMGLPLLFFALQIVFLVISMLVLIFAFGLLSILLTVFGNTGLYIGLLRLASSKRKVQFFRVYPSLISNKHVNNLCDEKNEPL